MLSTSTDDLAVKYSALRDDPSQSPEVREAARIFAKAEFLLRAEDDPETASQKASEAVSLFRELQDPVGVADSLRLHICALAQQEERKEALRVGQEELAVAERSGNRLGRAAMLLSLAEVACYRCGSEKREQAFLWAEEARRVYAQLGDRKMEGHAMSSTL
ncbi:unnamed protein product, partial [Polarella glacialis]